MNNTDDFYDGVAENYHLQYERDLMYSLDHKYPANYFRLHLLINSFIPRMLNNLLVQRLFLSLPEKIHYQHG